jgi:hypothetical protein
MLDYDGIIVKFKQCLYSNRVWNSIGKWDDFEDFYLYFKMPPDKEFDNVMMCYASLLYFLGSHYFFQSSEAWVRGKFGNLRVRRKVNTFFDNHRIKSYDIIYQDEQKTLKSTAYAKNDKILILLPCHKIVMLDKNLMDTSRYNPAKNDADIKIMNTIRKSVCL